MYETLLAGRPPKLANALPYYALQALRPQRQELRSTRLSDFKDPVSFNSIGSRNSLESSAENSGSSIGINRISAANVAHFVENSFCFLYAIYVRQQTEGDNYL